MWRSFAIVLATVSPCFADIAAIRFNDGTASWIVADSDEHLSEDISYYGGDVAEVMVRCNGAGWMAHAYTSVEPLSDGWACGYASADEAAEAALSECSSRGSDCGVNFTRYDDGTYNQAPGELDAQYRLRKSE